jgi:glycine amidinotransferase
MIRVISILVRLSTMNIKCSNDWGQLKEIIVGTAKGYRIPELNRSFKSCQFPEYDEKDIQVGPYPDWVIEEAEEDLDLLSQTLSSHGIIVHRPDTTYNHPDNWHHYSPRDCTLIVGNTIIETPSPILNRQYETWGYRNIFNSLHERGYKWIKAPTPILFDEDFKEDVKGVPSLNNEEILFEAANCIRVNDDILFQVMKRAQGGYRMFWVTSIRCIYARTFIHMHI